jgi:hypothetical protein
MYQPLALRSLVFARLPSTVTIEFKDVAALKNVVEPLSLLYKNTKYFPHARMK